MQAQRALYTSTLVFHLKHAMIENGWLANSNGSRRFCPVHAVRHSSCSDDSSVCEARIPGRFSLD